MSTVQRLLGYLYRPFSRDPGAFPALIIDYSGPMTWRVLDGTLTTATPNLPSDALSFDLVQYTLASLAAQINSHPRYTASVASGADSALAADVLLDGNGDGNTTLAGYQSLLYVIMHAYARQLIKARRSLADMLRQVRLDLAEEEWLEVWLFETVGGRRRIAENDAALLERIKRNILQIKSANLALEDIIKRRTGLSVKVLNIPWYDENGEVDSQVVADFGLTLLGDGRPAWGDPQNDNVLQGAFAVVFPDGTTVEQREVVLDFVVTVRAAGTHALAFTSASAMLHTNRADEFVNDADFVSGPAALVYSLWT
jgi:hypothetical protein